MLLEQQARTILVVKINCIYIYSKAIFRGIVTCVALLLE